MSKSRRDQHGKRINGEIMGRGVRIDKSSGKISYVHADQVGSPLRKRDAKASVARQRRRMPLPLSD
jgi:hypothetical protein